MSRVAVVTGSGRKRVGYIVARWLAERGFQLVLHYRHSLTDAEQSAEELRALGVRVFTLQADLAEEEQVADMAKRTIAEFGRVDVLVNCAAIWPRQKLEDVRAADLLANFQANTLGTFLTCQHFGLQMVKQASGGVIINFGDWADARPYLDYSAYLVSKAAIPGLTRCLAVELGGRNPKVRVNAVLPGPVMLPPDLPEHEKLEAVKGTLVKQEGSPRNIAQAVWSFIENDFITGVCLPVDGGRSIYANGY